LRIILLGAPGSGKGTQAKLICESLNIPHISTGDIFRDNISKNTYLGKQVKDYINKGELVPDEITMAAVSERLRKRDCMSGFLLDGFPRNLNQAGNLQAMLSEKQQHIDAVFYMKASRELILQRLVNRRCCSKCGRTYNVMLQPSIIQGICDSCGGDLIQREDDRKEVILERLAIYSRTIDPIVSFYRALGILNEINVSNELEKVFSNINSTLQAV
jgi:adenylate kinase